MGNEQPENKPQVEYKEETIECPKCGNPTQRKIWTIERFALWWDKCNNCGYEITPGSLLPPGKQN